VRAERKAGEALNWQTETSVPEEVASIRETPGANRRRRAFMGAGLAQRGAPATWSWRLCMCALAAKLLHVYQIAAGRRWPPVPSGPQWAATSRSGAQSGTPTEWPGHWATPRAGWPSARRSYGSVLQDACPKDGAGRLPHRPARIRAPVRPRRRRASD